MAVTAKAIVVASLLLLAACDRSAPPHQKNPPELVAIEDRVEETAFPSNEIHGLGEPRVSTRYFPANSPRSLGIRITFEDPSSETEVLLHFDSTFSGASDIFRQRLQTMQGPEEFSLGLGLPAYCSGRPLDGCLARQDKIVLVASARTQRLAKTLLKAGVEYATMLTS